MDTSHAARIRTHLLFLAILITAVVTRLLFLGDHSLWVDELFSLKYARLNLHDLLSEVAANDNHPPLYYVLLHFWVQAFGASEFALRSLSACRRLHEDGQPLAGGPDQRRCLAERPMITRISGRASDLAVAGTHDRLCARSDAPEKSAFSCAPSRRNGRLGRDSGIRNPCGHRQFAPAANYGPDAVLITVSTREWR